MLSLSKLITTLQINITYTHQCSNVLSYGITRLRLLRERIKNHLYIPFYPNTKFTYFLFPFQIKRKHGGNWILEKIAKFKKCFFKPQQLFGKHPNTGLPDTGNIWILVFLYSVTQMVILIVCTKMLLFWTNILAVT